MKEIFDFIVFFLVFFGRVALFESAECAKHDEQRQDEDEAEVDGHSRLANRMRLERLVPIGRQVALGSRQCDNHAFRRVEIEREVAVGRVVAHVHGVAHVEYRFDEVEFHRQPIAYLVDDKSNRTSKVTRTT